MGELLVRAISDTHGLLPDIAPCDILLIAGDVTPVFDHDQRFQHLWLTDNFNQWLREVPAKHIVGIGGNHDFILESDPELGHELHWHYLCDGGLAIEGVSIWGMPWVPNLPRWAFHKSGEALQEIAETIPECDILMTHGPPNGFGDKVKYKKPHEPSHHVGDPALAKELHRIGAKLHIFGHIHEGRGTWTIDSRVMANASMVDENYKRSGRRPMEFKLPRPVTEDEIL